MPVGFGARTSRAAFSDFLRGTVIRSNSAETEAVCFGILGGRFSFADEPNLEVGIVVWCSIRREI